MSELEKECGRLLSLVVQHDSAARSGAVGSTPPVQIAYTLARGYHLSIAADVLHRLPATLQRMFIQRTVKRTRVLCTTEQMVSLDLRQKEAFQEIAHTCCESDELRQRDMCRSISNRSLVLTSPSAPVCVCCRCRAVDSTHISCSALCVVWSGLDWLAQLSESVAWLDLTLSFADLVTRSPHAWVRPRLSEHGPMRIKEGRHPLMQDARMHVNVVPNDVDLSFEHNLAVVTGANGVRTRVIVRQLMRFK